MEWKQIQDLEYEVSDAGIVRNKKRHNVMSQRPIGNTPYLTVFLEVTGKQKLFSIHRLVALVHCPNPNNYPEVNHMDGNKLNNRADNLVWVTRSMNILHMYETGLKKYKPLHYKGKFGSQHNRSKGVMCVETGEFWGSMSEAERKLNIGQSAVSWSVKNKKPIFGMHFEIAS